MDLKVESAVTLAKCHMQKWSIVYSAAMYEPELTQNSLLNQAALCWSLLQIR